MDRMECHQDKAAPRRAVAGNARYLTLKFKWRTSALSPVAAAESSGFESLESHASILTTPQKEDEMSKIINGFLTSKVNAGSLEHGDMTIFGESTCTVTGTRRPSDHPGYVTLYMSFPEGHRFGCDFRINEPRDRVTGSRSGGQI